MGVIELAGLRGDMPIGAMAAFGVLRVCSQSARIVSPKLSWKGEDGDYRAVLTMENDISAEDLVTVLIADVRRGLRLPSWDQVKTCTRAEFRSAASDAANAASAADHEYAEWLAALANELAVGDNEKIKPTPFDMSVARQRFLADAVRLAAALSSENRVGERSAMEAYKEALFGPWKYQDDQHSLGWDPATMKLGAFTHKAPTGMTNSGVRAAVWLAFESLPLFPCFYADGLRTRGFVQQGREPILIWPIWRAPISVVELGTLLGWSPLTDGQRDRAELTARGVRALYSSERFKPNQYMVTFRPPQLVYSER